MTKIRAILEQENWTEIDVPDEYQAIVTSLFGSESSITGPDNESADGLATRNSEVLLRNDGSLLEEAGQSALVQNDERTDSIGTSGDVAAHVSSSRLRGPVDNNHADPETSVAQSSDSNHKERGRTSLRTLSYKGIGYHMVNWLVFTLDSFPFSVSTSFYVPS